MSGGAFDYQEFHLTRIAEEIEELIEKNGKPLTKEELKRDYWKDDDWYKKYPEDLYHCKYPDEIIEQFKEALYVIKKAYIYAHRIDYLLCGDDGEESFLKRLAEELEQNEKKL